MYLVTDRGTPVAWFYTYTETNIFCTLWENTIDTRLEFRLCTRWEFIKKVVFGK